MALHQERQIEAEGPGDAAGLGVAVAIAPALRIVAHDEDAGLLQRAIEGLGAPLGEAEKFLLAPRLRPCDGPAAFLPILRLGQPHQPVDELVGVRRQAEIGLGVLEGVQEHEWLGGARRQPLEAVGAVEPGAHLERDPPATIGPVRGPGKTPLWRPIGAMFLLYHRFPPLWLDRDGQAGPVNGNGNFRLTRTASFG